MTIYIATTEHGRGVRHVTKFSSRSDFLSYADEELSFNNASALLRSNSTVDDICAALYDNGPGFGSRSHSRVFRVDVKKLRDAPGVRSNSCWSI